MRLAVGPGAKMGIANPQTRNKGSIAGARGSAVQIPLGSTWQPSWGVAGVDVSSWQASSGTDTVDWAATWNQGVRFAYVKATEGNYFTSPTWGQQYANARNVGMIRGSYHFAIPNWSSGADQAAYFVSNGGAWSPDGATMPPVLDIEYNPYAGRTINGVYMGDTCYGLSANQMVQWISDFSDTMVQLTGRRPTVYSTTDWWSTCTGNSSSFSDNPLWIAAYNTSGPGTLPASWSNFSIWQYSSDGPFPGDSNVWNGDYPSLQRFATYGDTDPSASMGAAASAYAPLGDQTTGIACGLKSGGCYQFFNGGALLWSTSTGAKPSYYGAIRDRWATDGFENGWAGYPTTDQACGLVNGGCYQFFQGGAILWSQATGAQPSPFGPIRDAWAATGYENGPLGYPTSTISCGLANGGCYQLFQGGAVIWSQATGAQVSPWGPIRDAWATSGYENGPLGYPTGTISCGLVNGGCYQMFQGGAVIWSQSTGSAISRGGIRTAWMRNGAENGRLGYPVNNESCQLVNGGCYQMFQGGAVIWSPSTGGQMSPYGAIRTTWVSTGAENGSYGYPTSDEICTTTTSCYQTFAGGQISWTASGGTVATRN
jgi:GH25 family lysozyme M1 (1,4-beta-N-acetylmuramidase)